MTPLNDANAIRILQVIAQARLQPHAHHITGTPEIRAALAAALPEPPSTRASKGDLARAALALLAEDPAYAEPIDVMASQPPTHAQRYMEPASIALTTAALLVLEVRGKLKVDQTGKWSVEIEKQSAGDSALKLVVQHLLSLLPK